jgi:predicted DNA-binding transcriptional regulator
MENDRIVEIDAQLKQLKSSNPEVYTWIIEKERQKFLKGELSSEDPIRNCDENLKKLKEVESDMKYMKEKYSSLMLYDALISVKEKMLEKDKEICAK